MMGGVQRPPTLGCWRNVELQKGLLATSQSTPGLPSQEDKSLAEFRGLKRKFRGWIPCSSNPVLLAINLVTLGLFLTSISSYLK